MCPSTHYSLVDYALVVAALTWHAMAMRGVNGRTQRTHGNLMICCEHKVVSYLGRSTPSIHARSPEESHGARRDTDHASPAKHHTLVAYSHARTHTNTHTYAHTHTLDVVLLLLPLHVGAQEPNNTRQQSTHSLRQVCVCKCVFFVSVIVSSRMECPRFEYVCRVTEFCSNVCYSQTTR